MDSDEERAANLLAALPDTPAMQRAWAHARELRAAAGPVADDAAAAAAADDDDALRIGALTFGDGDDDHDNEPRRVAQRRDNEATPGSRPPTPAQDALAAPGAGSALLARRPSPKLQFERLRALNLEDDETGEIAEVYWADRLGLRLDGRSMDLSGRWTTGRPLATWRDSEARWKELERLGRRRRALSEVVVSRDVCACKVRVVDGDDELVEGARRCDVLSCQRARCQRCLVANPMAFGAACGECSPLVLAPEDAEDPGLSDGAPGLLRSLDMPALSALIGAFENVLVDDSEAAQKALKAAWKPFRSFLRPPEGVHFSPNEEGRRHARILLRRLKLWRRLERRLGMRKRGVTHSRVMNFLSKFFARAVVLEFKNQDEQCKNECKPPHANPGEGKCENCALVKKAIEKAIADAQPELEERLEGKGLKRSRDPSEDEIVEEATALLRVEAGDALASDDDVSEEGDSSSDDEKKNYKRGEGPLYCDHVKYWAIFRVLAGVQSKVFDLSLASTPRSSGPVVGATPTLRGSGTPSRTRGRC